MKPLQKSQDDIFEAWNQINRKWSEISSYWHDANRIWFEKVYWDEYEPEIRMIIYELEQLGDLFGRVYSDISQ